MGGRGGGAGGSQFSSAPSTPQLPVIAVPAHEGLSSRCSYDAWKLYLPTQKFSEQGSDMAKKLSAVERYIGEHHPTNEDERQELMDKRCFSVDLKRVAVDQRLLRDWPNIMEEMASDGETTLGVFGVVKHQAVVNLIRREREVEARQSGYDVKSAIDEVKFPVVRARLSSAAEPLMAIKDLKTSFYGRTVSLHGTVVRLSSVKPVCTWLSFECCQCLGVQSVRQPYGKYLEPVICLEKACKSR